MTILSEMGGNQKLLIALQEALVQVIGFLPGVTLDPRTVHRFGECGFVSYYADKNYCPYKN